MARGSNTGDIKGFSPQSAGFTPVIISGGKEIRAVISTQNRLTDITVPETILGLPVTEADCENNSKPCVLKNIELPSTLKNISDNFLCGAASGYYNIKIDENNPYFVFEDGVLYNSDKTKLVLFQNKTLKTFTVPETVKRIGNYAFMYSNIERVELPEHIKVINRETFYHCEKLSDINIGNIKKIDDGAFYCCMSLKSVVTSAQIIKNAAFHGCTSLESAELPNVTQIENRAFNSCGKLRRIMFSESLCHIGDSAFSLTPFMRFISRIPDKNIYNKKNLYLELKITEYTPTDIQAVITAYGKNDGKIKYKVLHCSSLHSKIWEAFSRSKIMFDLNVIDLYYKTENKYLEELGTSHCLLYCDLLKNAVWRLKYPYELTEEYENIYKKFIVKMSYGILCEYIDKGDLSAVEKAAEFGLIHKNNILKYIEHSAEKKQAEIAAYLLEFKSRNFSGADDDLILE